MNTDFLFYWIAIIITLCVWLILFIFSKKTRHEMIVVGLLLSPFVLIDYFTVPSYWIPKTLFNIPVGIEAFIFTFNISGIAAVVYEVLMRKRLDSKRHKLNKKGVLYLILATVLVVFLSSVIRINIIYFIIIEFLLLSIVICFFRKDLFFDSLYSALFFSVVYFLCFNLWILLVPKAMDWWTITGIRIGYMPIQELIFALSFGAFAGPLYEFLTNSRLK